MLRVCVSMMDEYGLCPMLIKQIAWLLLFGKLGLLVLASFKFLNVFLFLSKSP